MKNMNTIRYLKLSMGIVLCLLMSIPLSAQVNRNVEDEAYCKNKDYQFLFQGEYFYENKRKKAYLCSKNLLPPNVVTVRVVNKADQLPVPSIFGWEVNSIAVAEATHTITISATDFINDKLELTCTFIEPGSNNNQVSLEFNISTDIKLSFEESAKEYQYDNNKEQAFINSYGGTEALETPWNFIEANKHDILKAKVNKKKHFYTVDDIGSNHPDIDITPDHLSSSPENITIEFDATGQNIIEVRGCHATDPELLLYTEDPKTFNVMFIRVCETDDDVQLNAVGTVLANPFDVCIDGGVDLTIDEMNGPNFIKGDDYLFQNTLTGKWFVGAGPNLTCETEANPAGPPDCPSVFKTAPSITTANHILGKVAINIMNAGTITINANYEVIEEDGKMESKEQRWLHEFRHGINANPATPEVFLVDDLGTGSTGVGKVQGRATADLFSNYLVGKNTLAIDVKDATSYTLVHELGHAKWNLIHPGGPGKAGDPSPGQFGIDDLNNFMHGESNKVNNWNIRRYQFHLMH